GGERVRWGRRPRLCEAPARFDGLRRASEREPVAELRPSAVTELDHLREVVARVDVHDREGELAGAERLLGEPQEDDRVLAPGEEQHRPLALSGDLAHDVHRLRLELVEVRERELRRGRAHAPTSSVSSCGSSPAFGCPRSTKTSPPLRTHSTVSRAVSSGGLNVSPAALPPELSP